MDPGSPIGKCDTSLDLEPFPTKRHRETLSRAAAGWSGGSIVPGESASVPAPHHLTARAVRAAILMAASRIEARQRAERVKSALEAGLRLAGGGA